MKQEEARREREELLAKIEENKQLEQEQLHHLKEQNEKHQNDLLAQIEYNERLRADERVEQQRMLEVEQEAEAEYRRKVEELRNKPVIEKLHPMRRRQYQSTGQLLG